MPLSFLASAVASIGQGLISKKSAPKAIPVENIDPNAVAKDTVAGNAALFPAASNLAGDVNTFNQSEASRLLEQAIPGYSGIQKQLTESIANDLKYEGQLDPQQLDQISQFAAEKGISRGTSGGFEDLSLVRDFGFSMIDAKNADRIRALNTLSSVMGSAPRVNPTSPMASFVDPNTAISAGFRNAENKQGVEQAHENAKTAASNDNRAMWGKVFAETVGAGADWWQNKG